MKKLLILLSLLFSSFTHADTINLHWLNEDGTTYENSTCVIDSDLILPSTPPTKYGYTFTGWKILKYIPIEYLESTGTQWIDTGITPNFESTKIKTEINFTGNLGTQYGIFGTGSSGDSSRFWLVSSSGTYTWEAGLGPHYNILSQIQKKNVFIEFNPKNNVSYIVKIDNEQNIVDISNYSNTFGNIYIFSVNRLDSAVVSKAIIKMYYFQIYNNDVLVRDFIPVLDNNGTPCMYDKVEQKFYYNQGTGQFIAGPIL